MSSSSNQMSRRRFLAGSAGLVGSMTLGGPDALARERAADARGVSVTIEGARASIRNSRVQVDFDLATGTYSASSLSDGLVGFTGAAAQTDDILSSAAGLRRTAAAVAVHDGLGNSRALEVTCRRADGMAQVLEIALYPGKSFVALTAGVINRSHDPVRLREIHPLTGAVVFPRARSWDKSKTLDGGSGGSQNSVISGRIRQSVNNLLLTFVDAGHHRSLVAGGLTYHDFVKYAELGPAPGYRPVQIRRGLPAGQRLMAYLDCGPAESSVVGGVSLRVLHGSPYMFPGAEEEADPACGSVVFDEKQVVLEASGLQPYKSYLLGLSWWDYDGDGRVESVVAETLDGSQRATLVARRPLPAWKRKQQGPEQIVAAIPASVVSGGRVRVHVTNDAPAPNAVLSEAWLVEAPPPERRVGARGTGAFVAAPVSPPAPSPTAQPSGSAGKDWGRTRGSTSGTSARARCRCRI
ncbi:MAG TPA: hypothetical protein VFJ58_05225 [Armatimonadota bacterium]|nr:hypothetical protein [Armatimonadota bacterium]